MAGFQFTSCYGLSVLVSVIAALTSTLPSAGSPPAGFSTLKPMRGGSPATSGGGRLAMGLLFLTAVYGDVPDEVTVAIQHALGPLSARVIAAEAEAKTLQERMDALERENAQLKSDGETKKLIRSVSPLGGVWDGGRQLSDAAVQAAVCCRWDAGGTCPASDVTRTCTSVHEYLEDKTVTHVFENINDASCLGTDQSNWTVAYSGVSGNVTLSGSASTSFKTPLKVTHASSCSTSDPTLTLQMDTSVNNLFAASLTVGGIDIVANLTALWDEVARRQPLPDPPSQPPPQPPMQPACTPAVYSHLPVEAYNGVSDCDRSSVPNATGLLPKNPTPFTNPDGSDAGTNGNGIIPSVTVYAEFTCDDTISRSNGHSPALWHWGDRLGCRQCAVSESETNCNPYYTTGCAKPFSNMLWMSPNNKLSDSAGPPYGARSGNNPNPPMITVSWEGNDLKLKRYSQDSSSSNDGWGASDTNCNNGGCVTVCDSQWHNVRTELAQLGDCKRTGRGDHCGVRTSGTGPRGPGKVREAWRARARARRLLRQPSTTDCALCNDFGQQRRGRSAFRPTHRPPEARDESEEERRGRGLRGWG